MSVLQSHIKEMDSSMELLRCDVQTLREAMYKDARSVQGQREQVYYGRAKHDEPKREGPCALPQQETSASDDDLYKGRARAKVERCGLAEYRMAIDLLSGDSFEHCRAERQKILSRSGCTTDSVPYRGSRTLLTPNFWGLFNSTTALFRHRGATTFIPRRRAYGALA